MKLLLFGYDSQVGQALCTQLRQASIAFETLKHSDTLIEDTDGLQSMLMQWGIDFVVNVDHFDGFLPTGRQQAELENRHVLNPQNLARVCEKCEIPLLHLSDHQVFSGQQDVPYCEDDEADAMTAYGVTRWQGELSVQRFCSRFLILRAGPLFSTEGDNLLTRLLPELLSEAPGPFCVDEYLSPTSSVAIARVLLAILKQLSCDISPWGIYHYCAADITNRYDFAEVVLAILKQYDARYHAIDISADSCRQNRSYRIFNCQKIRDTFGIKQMPWRTELVNTLNRQFVTGQKNTGG